MALDELITYCEPTQVRHMMQVIEPQFQRDFISLLPKEVYMLTLKGSITTAADDIHKYFFIVFQRK